MPCPHDNVADLMIHVSVGCQLEFLDQIVLLPFNVGLRYGVFGMLFISGTFEIYFVMFKLDWIS